MKIEIKNLAKKFKNEYIFKDINMKLTPGHIYGLIGKNGSGKSVFLKLLCGFYEPTFGEIYFNNILLDSQKSFPPNLRALIEKPNFIPELTGFENLKILAKIQNIISDEDIIYAMEQVNIIEEKDKKYSKYSLGMKQKLGLAQVIMEKPEVLIFDEPLNGIEEETAIKFRNYLIEQKKQGKIIVIASHIKDDIELLCDVIYKFNNKNLELIDENKGKN